MMKFETLTNENFVMFAMKHYKNPSCEGIDEFYEDMNRLKYLKKLFQIYVNTGVIKDRLILNHLIILQNVLGLECSGRILFFKMPEQMYPILKTFMVFLNTLPTTDIPEADITSIQLDPVIVDILRNIGKV